MKTERKNPYVGPYSFGEQDADFFFGRERETRKLTALIISEQVVLFCAQSGAGKTSLVNAKLIPSLREQGFHVFPPARVTGDPPSGKMPANIFAYNVLKILSAKRAPGETLSSFLLNGQDSKAGQGPRVLILDQFEEILTAYPECREHRDSFFLQLCEVLQKDSKLSVVLVMREDHIAGLDRYALFLFGLRTRFRMERLRVEEAVAAIKKPAALAGRPFAEGVAEALAADLCQVHIAEEEGEKTVPGEFVEPVQLQIVCWQLWENLHDQPGHQITGGHVEKFGNIDRALEIFYENAIERAAAVPGATKTKVRAFCGTTLITPTRIRNQVSRGSKETGGLPNKAVEVLVEAHLIRPERVRGGVWYELAHDRLIEPILKANQRLVKPSQSQLSKDAQAWQKYGNDPSFLYRGHRLERAFKDNPEEMRGELERDFLDAARQWESEQRKRNTRRMGLVITGLSLGLIFAGIFAFTTWRESRFSFSRELALAAVNHASSDPQLSLLLALEALKRSSTLEAEAALHQALTASVARQNWAMATSSESAGVFAFSPQGKRIAFVDVDDRISIRDSSSSKLIRQLPLLPEAPTSLALNRQGNKLAIGNNMGKVSIWELSSQKPSRTFKVGYEINALAFSPAGDFLAVGGNSPEATVWNPNTGTRLSKLSGGHKDLVWDVAFSPDSERLATASEDGTVFVWNPLTGQILQRLTLELSVTGIDFGPNGRIATASQDGLAKIWNLQTRESLALVGHRDRVWDVAFSADGSYLATASFDRTVKLWRTDLGQEIRTLSPDGGSVRGVAFGGTGELAILNEGLRQSYSGTAMIWKLLLQDVPILSGHTSSITDTVFSPGGRHIASSDISGEALLWTLDGKRVAAFSEPDASLHGIAFGTEDLLATAGGDGAVRLWNLAAGPQIASLRRNAVALNAVKFASAGERLVAAAMDGTVTIWDVASRRSIRTLQAHGRKPILDVGFSPNGQLLATAGADGVVRIWDAATGKQLHELDEHSSAVFRVAFNTKGNRLATASVDRTAKLWNPQTGKELLTFAGHKGSLTSIAFSPDSRRVATGSVDRTVKLWDAEDGRELFTLLGHTDSIAGLSFSPDGKILATASADRTIRLEPLAIEDLVRIAHQRLTRTLTERERHIYLHE